MIYLTIKFINDVINGINLTFKLGVSMIKLCIEFMLLPFKLLKF